MQTADETNERTANELTCPADGCAYSHPSARGLMGHVPNAHPGGWDSTGVEPYEIHLEATVRDPEAFDKAAKVRAYLYRQGVENDDLDVFYDDGYDSVQIQLTDHLGDDWEAFLDATDVEGIHYVGDDRSYCTTEFVESLPGPDLSGRNDRGACEAFGCTNSHHIRPVEGDRGETRAVCRYHGKHYLGVTS